MTILTGLLEKQIQMYYNENMRRCNHMEKPTLKIKPKKYAGETTIVSMRMAKDLLKDIDAVAAVTGRNRNEILTMSLEFALNHMEIVMKEREEQ